MARVIMTVDDSASIRQMVNFTLAQAGYRVVEAADGEEALAKMQETAVDLLLADLNMPKMNGLELVEKVRELPRYRYMPVIMLTTESRADKKQAGKTAGATGWIVKPFKPDQLLAVVKKVLP